MKTCTKCHLTKSKSDFSVDRQKKDGLHSSCKLCDNVFRKAHPRNQEQKAKQAVAYRRYICKQYGLTLDEYAAMLHAQNGVCAICRGPEIQSDKGYLSIDHNHETGEIRGLLCHRCNQTLGRVKDSVEILRAMIGYLEKTSCD